MAWSDKQSERIKNFETRDDLTKVQGVVKRVDGAFAYVDLESDEPKNAVARLAWEPVVGGWLSRLFNVPATLRVGDRITGFVSKPPKNGDYIGGVQKIEPQ